MFDLDGTLVDSLPDIAAALNVALAASGHVAVTEADVAGMVGNGSEVLVSRALAAATGATPRAVDLAAAHDQFIAAYDAAPCVASRLYPDALDTLDCLNRQGIRLGICTNKPEAITHSVLRHLGVADRFASIVGGRTGVPLKPAPEMVLRTLRDVGVGPGAVVFVGDSAADAGAARAAGLRLVLLRHGYAHDNLDELGADAVLTGFAELSGALARMTFSAS